MKTATIHTHTHTFKRGDAGEACQAHNLEVGGSKPPPVIQEQNTIQQTKPAKIIVPTSKH